MSSLFDLFLRIYEKNNEFQAVSGDKKYSFSIIEHHISRNKLVLKNITRNFSPLILPYNAHLPHPVFPL
ncbi:hypothetical protein PARMER_00837 [Parabacteroides merdae ATCC 43184]|nr:hypothetical protein PARMER_00837 [Parabacteroides merdae ATCC 43184]